MLTYLLRRIAYGVLILFGVNLLTFVLFFAVNTPDDMARLNLGGRRVTSGTRFQRACGRRLRSRFRPLSSGSS